LSGKALVYVCAVCSSLCSVLLGYDIGVMSGAKEFIRPDLGLSSVQEEVVVGSLNIVAAFGGLVAGKAADSIGRKPTIALSCAVFISGAGIMTLSTGFVALLVGRIITGIGVGCAMVIAPVYITELAPTNIRGMLVSLTDICINVGILFGYGSSIACSSVFKGDSTRWRSMVGVGTIPPALILACLTLMPESPRWMISKGRDREGLAILRRVSEVSLPCLRLFGGGGGRQGSSWMDVLAPRDKKVQAAMLVGLGLGFWQQASGSEVREIY
ncbi:unnamed protein product, partial [Discosporangium mesarthrocarpum]